MNEKQEVKEEAKKEYKKIAVVRIRGSAKLKKEIKDTLNMLKLYRQNYCVVLNASPSITGMVKKIKCSYCGKNSFYIYHINKKQKKVDWAICFNCMKKFCDKILGEGQHGGRIEHKED